jgi:hypothetical protein
MANFPAQDVLETVKLTEVWQKGHFLYAEDLLSQNNDRIAKFTRLYNTYNGIVNKKGIGHLTQGANGRTYRAKYVSYRLSKTKIDLVNNEWLMRPLNSTVSTTNILSKTAKLDHYEMVLGASHAKKDIEKLRQQGVDPVEGMDIPDLNDESAWKQMSFKDKNQDVMQVLINSAITDMELKEKFNKNFQDVLITGMCYGQNTVTIEGDDDYITIDPRDAIFLEVDRDTFLAKSPIAGHREGMTLHDCLRKFSWTEQEKEKLKRLAEVLTNNTANATYRNRYSYIGKELIIDCIHIEWKSVRPTYYKISPLTNAQTLVNPADTKYRIELDTEEYERNKERYDKEVAKGAYSIEVKYQEELWEGWQIGHEIYKDVRRKPFTMRREDAPGDVFGFSYTGMLANTVNGYRVSMQELMSALGDAFDIVMYQMMREIGKVKGKAFVYDSAMLPRNTTIKDVLYQLANEGFVNINSSASGNMSNKDIAQAIGLSEMDLGLSASFPALVQWSREIKQMLDELSGISGDRQGQTMASSTATNAQSNIVNSRIVTEGWFFLTGMFCEKVFTKIAQQRKIIWGLYKPEKARVVLGDERFGFMNATRELAYCDYGIKFNDGGREVDLMRSVFQYAEASLNTKELRFEDVIQMKMAETSSEVLAIAKKGWATIQKMNAERQAQGEGAQMQMNNEQIQAQIQIAQEAREDAQKNEKDNIILEGDTQIRVDNNKMRGGMVAKQNEIEQTNLFSQTT